MKLSTRGRYGIHAMYDLAEHYGDGPQSIKLIAERQRIPEAYLEQLIGILRREKLVVSNRGRAGRIPLGAAAGGSDRGRGSAGARGRDESGGLPARGG